METSFFSNNAPVTIKATSPKTLFPLALRLLPWVGVSLHADLEMVILKLNQPESKTLRYQVLLITGRKSSYSSQQ